MRRTFVALALSWSVMACGGSEAPVQAPLPADPPLGNQAVESGAASTEVARGVAFIEHEKYAEARDHFAQAMATKPTPEAAFYLGVAKEKLGDRAGAEAAYKKALEMDPAAADAAQNLAALYLDDPPRPDEAIAVLKQALAKAPDSPKLHQNLGYAYGLKQDIAAATREYDLALKQADDPAVHFSYGTMLFENKQLEKAAVELKKALVGANDAPSLVTLGRMLGGAKAFGDCVKAFDRAIALQATDPEWFVRRGTCRHELKDEGGAQADFERAIQVEPSFAPGHYYLALSLVEQKAYGRALSELEKASKTGRGTALGKAAQDKLDDLERRLHPKK